MFYTYILEDLSGKLYIGQTNNMSDRVIRHNSARAAKYTKNKQWKLIYSKEFSTRSEAVRFEQYLKSLKNKEYIKKIIAR